MGSLSEVEDEDVASCCSYLELIIVCGGGSACLSGCSGDISLVGGFVVGITCCGRSRGFIDGVLELFFLVRLFEIIFVLGHRPSVCEIE